MTTYANVYAPGSTWPVKRGTKSEPSGMSPGMYANTAGKIGCPGEPNGQLRGTMRAGTSAWGDNESKRRGSPMNSRIVTKGNARRGG